MGSFGQTTVSQNIYASVTLNSEAFDESGGEGSACKENDRRAYGHDVENHGLGVKTFV
jgi:hypothetical protein